MLRYMIQANSSRVINDEKYKPLREAFKKIEEGKKIIKSDGKFDEEKRFIPIGYWKALEPYISEVAGELMKHPILLGDGDLIRLKEGELRYNEISKKVEANVVIASKKGMYHQEWRLETRAKYDPKDWARIANELLSVPGTDSNRGYFIGLLTEEFKEEIKRTRSSKQPLQCIAIGVVLVAIPAGIGFAYMVGVDIPAENTTKVGCAISGLFGTGLSFYGIKTRYKGLRVNVEKDFSFNIAPPEKQVFGVKEIIPINYNSGKNQ